MYFRPTKTRASSYCHASSSEKAASHFCWTHVGMCHSDAKSPFESTPANQIISTFFGLLFFFHWHSHESFSESSWPRQINEAPRRRKLKIVIRNLAIFITCKFCNKRESWCQIRDTKVIIRSFESTEISKSSCSVSICPAKCFVIVLSSRYTRTISTLQ